MLKSQDFAIAILNWNGQKLLEQFLPSVVQYSEQAAIYIIDNQSADDSVKWLKEHYPSRVQIIHNYDNLGYAGGYNRGLEQIKEPYVCLLNSDIEVSENWLKPICKAFKENPALGAVQPKILDLKQPTHFEYAGANGGFIDRLGYPFCRGRIFNVMEEDQGQYDSFTKIFWATGACFFIKKEVFLEVGELNPLLFAHMEEIDLCWRLHNYGYEVACEPASIVYHLGGGTLNKISPRKTYLNFRNNLIILFLNLPRRQSLSIIAVRLILDGLAALKFLAEGKPKHFGAVFRAHITFYRRLPILRKQRNKPAISINKLQGVYHRSVVFDFFGKNWEHFSDLKQSKIFQK